MLEGMYSAAAGMAAQQARLDALSNDVANASTVGYQRERVAFRDLVYSAERPGRPAGRHGGRGRRGHHDRPRRRRRRLPEHRAPRSTSPSRATATCRCAARRHHRADAQRPARSTPAASLLADGLPLQPPVQIPAGVDEQKIVDRRRRPCRRPGRARSARSTSSPCAPPTACRPIGDNLFVANNASGAATRAGTGVVAAPGRAGDLRRRHGRRDGRHDDRPARLLAGVQGDQHARTRWPRSPTGSRSERRCRPSTESLLPADVRTASSTVRQQYQAALSFEQQLVSELTKQLSPTAGDAMQDGPYAPAAARRAGRRDHPGRRPRAWPATSLDVPAAASRRERAMTARSPRHGLLGADVLAHLDAQLESARRLLDIVLRQGAAIRRQDVDEVLARLSRPAGRDGAARPARAAAHRAAHARRRPARRRRATRSPSTRSPA